VVLMAVEEVEEGVVREEAEGVVREEVEEINSTIRGVYKDYILILLYNQYSTPLLKQFRFE
jgi:hypothetical protein